MATSGHTITEVEPRKATPAELARVHSPQYIDEVLKQPRTSQWSGPRPDLAELAALFAGGTLTALDALLKGKTKTAIHFPGAKHHAQYDHSSGFCVFADFALAADIATKDHGLKVAIFDIDAHHGDGTENLTADNPNVLTYSVHEKGIFPGTGNESNPDKSVYNLALFDDNTSGGIGKGDSALAHATAGFLKLTDVFTPDLIFIAAGADGHREDPLSSLQYTADGFAATGQSIRQHYPEMPILIGGAGGYLPDTRTPEIWSTFSHAVVTTPPFNMESLRN